MSYQVLARKWRPQRFQDVIGQQHITQSLQNAVINKRLGHAYLLTGTRGVGKTSVARIFAKALRCENLLADGNACHKCEACIDFDSAASMNFIEIDGASHNSVDNIRELVNNVQYLPTKGHYKVYLIDEVHMLSQSAFNALLKTLEEPPEHVIFVLATTEPQKLLETVLSRCQRFDFRSVAVEQLLQHLIMILDAEKIEYESTTLLRQIAKQAKGSVRDALSLLDQVLSFTGHKRIDQKLLTLALGLASTRTIKDILSALLVGNSDKISRAYDELLSQNVNLKNIAISLIEQLFLCIENIDRPDFLEKNEIVDIAAIEDVGTAELIWIYENLSRDSSWVVSSLSPEQGFLVLLQKLSMRREFLDSKQEKPYQRGFAGEPAPSSEEKKKEETPAKVSKSWEDFLSFLAKTSAALSSYLAHGNLLERDFLKVEQDKKVSLAFKGQDHLMHELLQEKENYEKIKEALANYLECSVEDVKFNVKTLEEKDANEIKFQSISEIEKEKKEKLMEDRRNNFLNHELIVQAQTMFNSKIDKVVLKNQER